MRPRPDAALRILYFHQWASDHYTLLSCSYSITLNMPKVLVLLSGGLDSILAVKILQEQTELFWDLYGRTETNKKFFAGQQKNFAVMKKHFKAYVSGFAGASNLRAKLMAAENPEAVKKIIREAEKEGLGCLV